MDLRTNNKAKVFGPAWNSCVRVHHLNLWTYFWHLKDLQSLTKSDIIVMN